MNTYGKNVYVPIINRNMQQTNVKAQNEIGLYFISTCNDVKIKSLNFNPILQPEETNLNPKTKNARRIILSLFVQQCSSYRFH